MLDERLEDLFQELVELPATDREVRLASVGPLTRHEREELMSLLRAYEAEPAFLAQPDLGGAPPSSLGKYAIREEIGRGGSGLVYLARDPDLDRFVAIKVFSRSPLGPGQVKMLRREARALAGVNHPNVAQVYSIEEVASDQRANRALLTMEYVPGMTLAERLRDGPLRLELCLDYGRQIAGALEAAHQRSIVHRDLKPQNIRVTPEGWIKVLDFGLAQMIAVLSPEVPTPAALDAHSPAAFTSSALASEAHSPATPAPESPTPATLAPQTSAHASSAGTPGYMSPEQCGGRALDARSDLWAFGAVLYESLTGEPAISGETLAEVIEANRRGHVRFDLLSPSLPPRILELTRSCLESDPDARWSSAGAARRLLEDELLRLRAGALLFSAEHGDFGEPEPGTERRDPEAPRGNLPRPLSSFIGREALLAQLEGTMRERRLVTLSGPGGVGKTRVSLELARRIEPEFPGGAWFVDLSAVTNGADAPAAILRTLGIREVRDDLGEGVARAIETAVRKKRALLVLDNCEHVLDGVSPFIEGLLARVPSAAILATSRQSLGISGEDVVTLTPLTLPQGERGMDRGADSASVRGADSAANRDADSAANRDADSAANRDAVRDAADAAIRSESVSLFLDRARSRAHGFAPAGLALHLIEEICRKLDGLPLAIELAASHARALALDEILARVTEGRSLPESPTTAHPRHRSLRGLVDWSYRLLPAKERALLRRLSVFRGGCTLGAAEAVGGGWGGVESWEVCDLLVALVERSLVEPVALDSVQQKERGAPAPRYRLLETIRVFASDRLGEDPTEETEAGTRFLAHLGELAALRPGEKGPTRSAWVRRIEPDYANLIHALEVALSAGKIGAAYSLGELLGYYWVQGGEWLEGTRWMDRLLAARAKPSSDRDNSGGSQVTPAVVGPAVVAPAVVGPAVVEPAAIKPAVIEPAVEVRLISQAGLLAVILHRVEAGEALIREGLRLGTALGEPGPLALIHETAGVGATHRGDMAEAAKHFVESKRLFEEARDPGGAATCLGNLGVVESVQGHHESALRYYREHLRLGREMGDRLAEGKALLNIGWTATALGSFEEAEVALDEALSIHEANEDMHGVAVARRNLGALFLNQGKLEESRDHLREACRLCHRVGDLGGVLSSLTSLARVIQAEGNARLCAEIVSEILHTVEAGEIPFRPENIAMLRTWKEDLDVQLGPQPADESPKRDDPGHALTGRAAAKDIWTLFERVEASAPVRSDASNGDVR